MGTRETEKIEINHTGGVGWFFFSMIPAAVAGAALMWLAFYTGVVDWRKVQRIEGRMDNRVGVNGQLTAPVELIMRNTGCLKIARAYIDGGEGKFGGSRLVGYVHNGCENTLSYWEIHWNSVAPDGTIIHSDYTNQYGPIDSNQTMEIQEDVRDDSRTAKVIVWAGGH